MQEISSCTPEIDTIAVTTGYQYKVEIYRHNGHPENQSRKKKKTAKAKEGLFEH